MSALDQSEYILRSFKPRLKRRLGVWICHGWKLSLRTGKYVNVIKSGVSPKHAYALWAMNLETDL